MTTAAVGNRRSAIVIAPGDRARFLAKLSIGGLDACWEWQGFRNRTRGGYGMGRYGSPGEHGKRRFVRAHRVSYVLFNGNLGPGDDVGHRCDNPPCCNPHHLFAGPRGDNVRDASAKGLLAFGEGNGSAKLTGAQVAEIRRRYAEGGISQRLLGIEYGVSQGLVSLIVLGKLWR